MICCYRGIFSHVHNEVRHELECFLADHSPFKMSETVVRSHDCKRTTLDWVTWSVNNGYKDIILDPKGEPGKVCNLN